MENIKHWMDIIVGITILYTSLVEVFLKHSLMDDPDTGNIATRFFKKKFHKFELIICFCSVVPIIGQIYALILSLVAIYFDKNNFIIIIRDGKKSSTLREFFKFQTSSSLWMRYFYAQKKEESAIKPTLL